MTRGEEDLIHILHGAEVGAAEHVADSGWLSCGDDEGLGPAGVGAASPTFRLRMTRLGSLSTCSSSSGFRTLHWRR